MTFEFLKYVPFITQVLFTIGVFLFLLCFYTFFQNKKSFLPLLFLSALTIALCYATAIPWLYPWDEQFHALVGKNLSKNPFHPILVDLDPKLLINGWTDQKTWLHKQPLFLYQIALSVKLFGTSALAVRLPSVILHAIAVLAIYDMGKLFWTKKNGFLAASMFLFSYYPLGLLSGRIGTDHNDSVFMVYVLLSFWAYFRYLKNKSKKWANWIGIFVGLAVLTKWVVGLLVFAPWGLYALMELRNKNFEEFKFLFRALLIALIHIVPWQIYIHLYFPDIANFELAYNSRHFFEALEGHVGDWTYHFQNIPITFVSPYFLIPLLTISLIFSLRKSDSLKPYFSLWIASLVLFTFFTIAKTKMTSFIIPCLPFVFLIISYGITSALEYIKSKRLELLLSSFIFCSLIFLFSKVKDSIIEFGFQPNATEFYNRPLYQEQYEFIKKYDDKKEKTIVLNSYLRGFGNISWMFFGENKATPYLPTPQKLNQMKTQGYQLKCIQWNDTLPDYILEDKSIELIPFQ